MSAFWVELIYGGTDRVFGTHWTAPDEATARAQVASALGVSPDLLTATQVA